MSACDVPAGTASSSSSALAPPRSFVTRVPPVRGAMGIADGVRAALGDSGEKRLGSERPVDGRLGIEAESGYAAHELSIRLRGSDDTRT